MASLATPFRLGGEGAARLRDGDLRIVIVGASGWLGSACLDLLHGLLEDQAPRRVACFGSEAKTLGLQHGLTVPQRPLAELGALPPAPTLVLHLAFLTQEKARFMPEADYVAINRSITSQVLNSLDAMGAEAVFLASSGAAGMADAPGVSASKRLYGALKRQDEEAVRDWAAGGAGRCVVSRIFNLSGPYINKRDSYAISSFIADARAGRPISIQARNRVYRSYVAIQELLSIAFGALTDEAATTIAFETAGAEILEMADLAEAVAAALGSASGTLRPPLDREASDDRYVGDRAAYASLQTRYDVPTVCLADQIRATADYIEACDDASGPACSGRPARDA